MKKVSIILLLLFSLSTFSQNLEVEYSVSENTNDAILATSTIYNLIISENQSAYFNNVNDSIQQFKYQNLIFDVEKIGELKQVKLSDNHYAYIKQDYFYKNYTKDTLIFNEIILNKKVFVGEKINLFNWEIKPKSDTLVLGFKCQKATAKFRGRTYEATFSNEIAPYGGPWKFDGLPGLIVSVKSLDNYFVIEPRKIKKDGKTLNLITNIYENKKVISWNMYKNTFEERLREQLKKLKSISEDGEVGNIKITDKIEDLELPEMKF
ncbi:GLPGLI family protein [Flavobacterium sp. 25HG05S-40]|uniref:GLPGLI family protein n=1 Tax=Flavobacterium sp. 25HG05S-40 TaxID=3458682 RepID=UPI004044ACA4